MDEETKKKIWETFKEVFIEEGIASPDDVEFKSGSLPTEEVHRHGGFMRKLGRCGKAIVWLIKGGWKVGKVGMVAGWIIIMVADLPDAIVKIHTRYPKAQEVVKNVGEIVRDWSAPNEKQAGFMVVIDPKWEINLEKYHKDMHLSLEIDLVLHLKFTWILKNFFLFLTQQVFRSFNMK